MSGTRMVMPKEDFLRVRGTIRAWEADLKAAQERDAGGDAVRAAIENDLKLARSALALMAQAEEVS